MGNRFVEPLVINTMRKYKNKLRKGRGNGIFSIKSLVVGMDKVVFGRNNIQTVSNTIIIR
jgi:hypothetical protein